jgi:hypothetical protein
MPQPQLQMVSALFHHYDGGRVVVLGRIRRTLCVDWKQLYRFRRINGPDPVTAVHAKQCVRRQRLENRYSLVHGHDFSMEKERILRRSILRPAAYTSTGKELSRQIG